MPMRSDSLYCQQTSKLFVCVCAVCVCLCVYEITNIFCSSGPLGPVSLQSLGPAH